MVETVTRRFTDRYDAGRQLAERLRPLAVPDPVVRALGAPLDVIVVGKIGAPGNPEFGPGWTARAALRAARRHEPCRLVLAVPVGSPDSVASLRAEADEVICLL